MGATTTLFDAMVFRWKFVARFLELPTVKEHYLARKRPQIIDTNLFLRRTITRARSEVLTALYEQQEGAA